MKKPILIYLLGLIMPFVVAAQNKNPQTVTDFAKGIKLCNTFAFNDHLNIMQVTTDDDQFDLVAVDEKLQIVWKTTLKGYGIKTDKFKNKIVALAATDHGRFKGTSNTFEAYVVDPENGKVLADKIVYHSTDDYMEYPQMYTAGGEYFKLAVRQSGYKRGKGWGMPLIFGYSYAYAREFNETNKPTGNHL